MRWIMVDLFKAGHASLAVSNIVELEKPPKWVLFDDDGVNRVVK